MPLHLDANWLGSQYRASIHGGVTIIRRYVQTAAASLSAFSRIFGAAVSPAIRFIIRALDKVPHGIREWLARIAVALIGATLGLLLGARISDHVGPFDAKLNLTPNIHGGTTVQIPPLGSLNVDSHSGPVQLGIELTRLRQTEAEALLKDPGKISNIGEDAAGDVKNAVTELAIKAGLCAIGGAVILSILVYRKKRWEPFIAAGLSVAMLAGAGGLAASTWRPNAVSEPTYTGLLSNAPAIVGDARNLVDRFDSYQKELAGIVTNVSKLYAAASTLPAYKPDSSTIRILHVSDLHLNPAAYQVIGSVVKQFNIDAVVDTGDLTDWGSDAESSYVNQIAGLKVPYIYIRGNHDSTKTADEVRKQKNAQVLNGGDPITIKGLTFMGVGDPRFTPDKNTRDDHASVDKVQSAGNELSAKIAGLAKPPDVVLLHDPLSAIPLKDQAPLVLAGHAHHRDAERLGNTLVLTEGSTGGAGLRGLEKEKPTPIESSVLYFDAKTHQLQAHDDITLGGLGQTEATIQRHQVGGEPAAGS